MTDRDKHTPRLRTVDKVEPPYPLNRFPDGFASRVAKEVVYHLATQPGADLQGEAWEEIFANCVGGEWKPSKVGLDDVQLGQCAWGAKTVKGHPSRDTKCRLISGRNSISYSFGRYRVAEVDPNEQGSMVLDIWNERVSAIRQRFKHARTVVLVKGRGLLELGVFEIETIRFEPERYSWQWNDRGNLEGFDADTGKHRFTWQHHGSQFTIIEEIPDEMLLISLQRPAGLSKEAVLRSVGFDESWVKTRYRILP